jgi:hypothetical protein
MAATLIYKMAQVRGQNNGYFHTIASSKKKTNYIQYVYEGKVTHNTTESTYQPLQNITNRYWVLKQIFNRE